MHSVPTLCATATILGVSSVGYALARHAELEAPSSGKVVPPVAPSSTSTRTRTTTLLAPAISPFSTPLASPIELSHRPSPLSRHLTSSRKAPKPLGRRSIGDGPLPRIRDDDEDRVNQSDSDIPEPLRTLRPRSSWVKRLSTRSVDSSPASSPRPESPAMASSVAVSYNSSTAPIVPGHAIRPLPPNKLVKRSSSFRATHSSGLSGQRILQFRRPATSHQRAQTVETCSSPLQASNASWHQQPNQSPSVPRLIQTDHSDDFHEGQWQQYFTAKVSKDLLSRKRSSTGDVQYIKRIVPDDRFPPTLIMAKSLSAASIEVEEVSSHDGDSVFYSSRPVTPSGFDTDTGADPRTARPTRSSPSLKQPEAEPKPRRSFSIGDFLATGPAWPTRTKASKTPKLTRRVGRRVFSSPLLGLSGRHSIDVASERPNLNQRRDITDPTLYRHNMDRARSRTPVSVQRVAHDPFLAAVEPSITNTEHSPAPRSSPAFEDCPLPSHTDISRSPTLSTSVYRPSRYSTTTSERASTLVGSDTEFRGVGSGDDDDSELNDDSQFTTLRMRPVRSSSKQRGPRIETIFDESPPKSMSRDHISALRDVSPNSARKTRLTSKQFEQENIAVPTRDIMMGGRDSSPSINDIQTYPVHEIDLSSSPPDMPWTLPKEMKDDNDDDDAWFFEDDESDTRNQRPPLSLAGAFTSPAAENSLRLGSTPKSASLTPRQYGSEQADKRSSIFDWSEQLPNERSPSNRTPPRPRTVHGKKDTEVRGPRSSRRAPSSLHARSQSVPVVPDLNGKRGTTGTNKFGTWGVGSKGVTEDWDDDFDFGDSDTAKEVEEEQDEQRRIDSGVAMRVPDTIREQQSNVMANIGLLREWGLLIEELKELRIRAVSLGVLEVSPAEVWKEVDAMIDLADQEPEDEVLSPPHFSPPSSPGFDTDAFDELSLEPPVTVRNVRGSSRSPGDRYGDTITPAMTDPSRSHRKSILPAEHDIFGPVPTVPTVSSIPTVPTISEEVTPYGTPKKETPSSRPRKDSEAVARSVIEMLQKRRSTHDPLLPLQPVPNSKKVPFDTATLRHIVPYVHGLMRKIKEVIRDAEGLYRSPNASPRVPDQPQFSQIFESGTPDHSPTRRRRKPRVMVSTPTPDDDSTPAETAKGAVQD